jgi:LAS superfamily LD-carboxypeptidase LdcB
MSYEEKRVRVADFGRVPLTSDLLVSIPSVAGADCKVHVAIAGDLLAMMAACKVETGEDLLVVSGARAHRWASREAYESYLVQHYGSVAEGRKWIAFDSPHETGLCVDFGSCGLSPDRKTVDAQRQTRAWLWLHDNAWRFGFHPYLPETWHWEHWISREAWLTGNVAATATTEG